LFHPFLQSIVAPCFFCVVPVNRKNRFFGSPRGAGFCMDILLSGDSLHPSYFFALPRESSALRSLIPVLYARLLFQSPTFAPPPPPSPKAPRSGSLDRRWPRNFLHICDRQWFVWSTASLGLSPVLHPVLFARVHCKGRSLRPFRRGRRAGFSTTSQAPPRSRRFVGNRVTPFRRRHLPRFFFHYGWSFFPTLCFFNIRHCTSVPFSLPHF